MTKPTCSLIITTYNRPEALNLVLLSVLKQTQWPNEVIIADDGSGEETRQLIAAFQKQFPVPLIHSWQEDEGFRAARSRNLALKKAQFDYIIMLDGDMVLERHFVQDHLTAAKSGYFIQGRRALLDRIGTEMVIAQAQTQFRLCSKHLANKLNVLRCPLLSKIATPLLTKKGIRSIKSCNLAAWRDDVLAVNGYNEDFIGWGREDSEFVVRLLNHGILRRDLRFAAIAYHLYHHENTRKMLPFNDELLAQAIKHKSQYCSNGLVKGEKN